MKNFILIGLCLTGFAFPSKSGAQPAAIDSLKNIISGDFHDTLKLIALTEWDGLIYMNDQELDKKLNERIIHYADSCFGKNNSKKTRLFLIACKGKAMNNLGMVYFDRGNYKKAIELHSEALKLNDKLKDTYGRSVTLGNLANIYYQLTEYDKALEYYHRSKKEAEKIGNNYLVSISLNNIANIYADQKNFEQALKFYRESLKIASHDSDSSGISRAYNNIGSIYFDLKNYDSSLIYHEKALIIRKTIEDIEGIASSGGEIGLIYLQRKQFQKALEYLLEAEELAEQSQSITVLRDVSESLYLCYENLGQFREAMNYHKVFVRLKDSVASEENTRASIQREYKYSYEKQAEAIRIKSEQQKKIDEARLNESNAVIAYQETQKIALYGGLALVLLFLIYVFNRYKVVHGQKLIIEEKEKETHYQKQLIEEKQHEILDSITYAKRIQDAILPSDQIWNETFKRSFIFYRPKDIIAGDFYWLENRNNLIFFAVADCTGHGVPGAMVSVICSTALTKCIAEYHLEDPGKILDKTRELVIRQFEKSSESVRDGMDISLCCWNKNTRQLLWAGANNPLILIRNGEKLEWYANKEPIGKYENPTPFTTHQIAVAEGDMIYLFSDGYADQFGGPAKKKFRKNNLYELFLQLAVLPEEEQKCLLELKFTNWKGNLEQIDDICVIGIRM